MQPDLVGYRGGHPTIALGPVIRHGVGKQRTIFVERDGADGGRGRVPTYQNCQRVQTPTLCISLTSQTSFLLEIPVTDDSISSGRSKRPV